MGDRGSLSQSTKEGMVNAFKKRFRDLSGKNAYIDPNVLKYVDTENLRLTLNSVLQYEKKYPNLMKHFSAVNDFSYAPTNAMACASDSDVELNLLHFASDTALRAAYEQGVADGFHPAGTTVKNIIDHELGHVVAIEVQNRFRDYDEIQQLSDEEFQSIYDSGIFAQSIVETAYADIQNNFKQYGYKNKSDVPELSDTVKQISGYATRNFDETIAEAMAMQRGTKSVALSKAIEKLIQRAEKGEKIDWQL